MTVRAKMHCNGISKRLKWNHPGEFTYEADFSCVSDTSEENKKFFEATPAGQLKLSTLRGDFFQPGKDYYIDITEVS